jgi:hypothetical protein
MNRWIVALPLLAVGVSISGGDTAAAGSLIEAVADALSPTKVPLRASAQEQKPTVSGARHRHRLVRRSNPQTSNPRTAFAKARTPDFIDAHAVIADEEDQALKPRRVATISVPPLADSVDDTGDVVAWSTDDRAKIPSLASATPRSLADSGATELIMLLSGAASAASGIYGFVAFNSRRRLSRPSQKPVRRPTRLVSSEGRYRDRSVRQGRFPHQVGLSFLKR